MKTKTFWLLALATILGLVIGVIVACGGGGGGGGGGTFADDDASVDDDTTPAETWTDPATGLTWQVVPSSHDGMPWADAISYCQNSILAGGGWRLPTISELRTLVRGCDGAATGGACTVTDSCTDAACYNDSCVCATGAGPNNGCYGPVELWAECEWLWSSTEVRDDNSSAWRIYFDNAAVGDDYKDSLDSARCVR